MEEKAPKARRVAKPGTQPKSVAGKITNNDLPSERVQKELARRKRVIRTFPAAPIEESILFAQDIFRFGSGESVRRLTLFDHLNKSPESGASRQLITNSSKYGLIKGGYQSDIIELTADGVRAVDPQMPMREQARARIKLAVQDIDIFSKLYERFVGKALPARAALIDAAIEFDVNKEASEEAVETFIVNLRFVGLLRTLSGAERIVSIDLALDQLPTSALMDRAFETQSSNAAIITAEHAHFETVCFYITPIGSSDSEQRQHADLFFGSIVEPALQSLD